MLKVLLALSLSFTSVAFARSGSVELRFEKSKGLNGLKNSRFIIQSISGTQEATSIEHHSYEFSIFSHFSMRDDFGNVMAEAYQDPTFPPTDFLFGRRMVIQDHLERKSYVIKRTTSAFRKSPSFDVFDSKKELIGSIRKLLNEAVYVYSDTSDEPQGEVEIYSDRMEVRYASLRDSRLLVGFAALRARQKWVSQVQKGLTLGLLAGYSGYLLYRHYRLPKGVQSSLPPLPSPPVQQQFKNEECSPAEEKLPVVEIDSPQVSFTPPVQLRRPLPPVVPIDNTIPLKQFVGDVVAKTVEEVVVKRFIPSPKEPSKVFPEIRIQSPTPPSTPQIAAPLPIQEEMENLKEVEQPPSPAKASPSSPLRPFNGYQPSSRRPSDSDRLSSPALSSRALPFSPEMRQRTFLTPPPAYRSRPQSEEGSPVASRRTLSSGSFFSPDFDDQSTLTIPPDLRDTHTQFSPSSTPGQNTLYSTPFFKNRHLMLGSPPRFRPGPWLRESFQERILIPKTHLPWGVLP